MNASLAERVAAGLTVVATWWAILSVVFVAVALAVRGNMGYTEAAMNLGVSALVVGLALGVSWLLRRWASSARTHDGRRPRAT